MVDEINFVFFLLCHISCVFPDKIIMDLTLIIHNCSLIVIVIASMPII